MMWIDVSDELPPRDTPVIVRTLHTNAAVAYIGSSGSWFTTDPFLRGQSAEDILSWRFHEPRPDAPEQTRDERDVVPPWVSTAPPPARYEWRCECKHPRTSHGLSVGGCLLCQCSYCPPIEGAA